MPDADRPGRRRAGGRARPAAALFLALSAATAPAAERTDMVCSGPAYCRFWDEVLNLNQCLAPRDPPRMSMPEVVVPGVGRIDFDLVPGSGTDRRLRVLPRLKLDGLQIEFEDCDPFDSHCTILIRWPL